MLLMLFFLRRTANGEDGVAVLLELREFPTQAHTSASHWQGCAMAKFF